MCGKQECIFIAVCNGCTKCIYYRGEDGVRDVDYYHSWKLLCRIELKTNSFQYHSLLVEAIEQILRDAQVRNLRNKGQLGKLSFGYDHESFVESIPCIDWSNNNTVKILHSQTFQSKFPAGNYPSIHFLPGLKLINKQKWKTDCKYNNNSSL